MLIYKRLCLLSVLILCAARAFASEQPSIVPVDHVDLSRFMGRWYVIAAIPTRFEQNAWNAVETYERLADDNVDTEFRFNSGGFEGPLKHIHSIGYVRPHSGNAVWGVQVFWPIKAQYVVAYLREDYSQTIVARDARDYTWVMARTPSVTPADYEALIDRVKSLGYDVAKIRKVPQQWPDSEGSQTGTGHETLSKNSQRCSWSTARAWLAATGGQLPRRRERGTVEVGECRAFPRMA